MGRDTLVTYSDGTEDKFRRAGDANLAAVEHYLETGAVPAVDRGDGKDAGLAAARPDGGHPIYHFGSDYVDTRTIVRLQSDGERVALVDLENGEEVLAPSSDWVFEPEGRTPTASQVRELGD